MARADVPYEQSELMAKKFKQKSVPFTFIPIDHGKMVHYMKFRMVLCTMLVHSVKIK